MNTKTKKLEKEEHNPQKASPVDTINGDNLWRSYESYIESQKTDNTQNTQNTTKAKKQYSEFPEEVREMIDDFSSKTKQIDRKQFLTLMGASITMLGISCTKRPVEKIVPYLNRPQNTVPGKSLYFASSSSDNQQVVPILARTREGKPLKIEGNYKSYLNGAMEANTFATIWDLYDPDRIRSHRVKINSVFVDVYEEDLQKKLTNVLQNTQSLVVFSRPTFSPSENQIIKDFLKKIPQSKNIVYDPIGDMEEVMAGNQMSYNRAFIPQYKIQNADVVLSVEADFLGTWLNNVWYARQFANRRNPENKDMLKLITVESSMSLTGSNSDERHALFGNSALVFLLGLANIIVSKSKFSDNENLRSYLSHYNAKFVSGKTNLSKEAIQKIAESLIKAKGRSLVLAGGLRGAKRNRGELQAVVNLINEMLENNGKTISNENPFYKFSSITSQKEMKKTLQDMQKGKVDTVIINNTNPLFDFPKNANLKEALENVKNVIYIGSHYNMSAKHSQYILAKSHFLESWSDAYSNGFYSVVQPVITPLYDTLSLGDIWFTLGKSIGMDTSKSMYAYIQSNTKLNYYSNTTWGRLLKKGFVDYYSNISTDGFRLKNITAIRSKALSHQQVKKKNSYILNFYKTVAIGDGYGANISFRQELPDPITKSTWGNFVAVSPHDAKENNWKTGKVIEIASKQHSARIPVFVQPGQAQGTLSVAIGYGHEMLGKVANGVGTNAYNFSDGTANTSNFLVQVKNTRKFEAIATTQIHNAIEETVDAQGVAKRVHKIARSTELKEYAKDP